MARWCRFSRFTDFADFADPDNAGHSGKRNEPADSAGSGAPCFGLVQDEQVIPVEGSPFGAYRLAGDALPLSSVNLLPPVVPTTFFCVGLNYRDHILHAQASGSALARFPERPEIGYRANNALIGHGQTIVIPRDFTGTVEAEGEAVAIIGKKLRRASRDEARAGIFGWTIGNDVSAREWQRSDRTFWRAKNADTFKPMGPWIDTEADVAHARTRVHVHGGGDHDGAGITREFATGAMIFDALDYLVEISKYITLAVGDVLWMGADGTVPIRPGDTVTIDITGIGTLGNAVAREKAR